MNTLAEYIGLLVRSMGLCVFPLKPGTKVPATAHGQDDASNDLATVTRWAREYPRANWGIFCAPSGLYVIDVDCGDGKIGQASWDALVAQHGHVDTFTVRTQSGGLHFYYRMPPSDALTNTAGKLGKHIDTRGNGYVVAPGSTVNGREYEVVNDVPIADLPQWVVEAVRKPTRPAPVASTAASLYANVATADDVQDRVRQLSITLGQAAEGEGNNTAAAIAYMVGQYVGAGQIDALTAEASLLEGIAHWTYRETADQAAMERTIRLQIAEGAKSPRPWEAARFPVAPALAAVPSRTRDLALVGATTDAVEGGEDDDDSAGVESGPRETVSDFFTDAGQGRWLADRLQGVTWAPGLGWMLWDGARWKNVEPEAVSSVVRLKYADEFAKWAAKYGQTGQEKDLAMAKGFKRLLNSSSVSGVLGGLRDTVFRNADEFDAHPYILNCANGVVDLRTGKITPHAESQGMLLTKVTAGKFVPGYRHPDWEAAKGALPAETLEWLQLRMGAAVAGSQIADDAVFLQGGGSNGKSLFSNDGVVRALGDYAMLKSSALIATSKSDANAATPDKAELKGARFVLIEELPEEFALSTKAVKELAGTGKITARKLYQHSIEFDSTHSLFVNTNHVPNVTDTDWGTWRRLTMVTFPYTFTSRPVEENDRKGDRDLVQRIRANVSGQYDAIVTWLVEGAQSVLADGSALVIGKRDEDDGRAAPVKEATWEWRKSTDRLMAYADEHLTADPTAVIAKTDLSWHFNQWMQEQGASKWSARLMGDRMKGHPSFQKVTIRRQGAEDTLSRPPREEGQFLPTLSSRPEVYTGIRFTDTPARPCACPNAANGIHSPNCTTTF